MRLGNFLLFRHENPLVDSFAVSLRFPVQVTAKTATAPFAKTIPLFFWLVLTVVVIVDLWLYLHVGYKLRSLESGSDY